MKLWCYFIVWMPPPTPTQPNPNLTPTPPNNPSLLFHSSLGPSTHSLSSLSPAHTFHPCFIGVNAVTCNVKSPRVCSPLCSDHLWQMRVLCVRHVAPLTSCYHPLSLYHQRDDKGRNGGGGWCVKDGWSGAVCPDMTNPEGDASLSPDCCVKWHTGRCSVTSLCQCLD